MRLHKLVPSAPDVSVRTIQRADKRNRVLGDGGIEHVEKHVVRIFMNRHCALELGLQVIDIDRACTEVNHAPFAQYHKLFELRHDARTRLVQSGEDRHSLVRKLAKDVHDILRSRSIQPRSWFV